MRQGRATRAAHPRSAEVAQLRSRPSSQVKQERADAPPPHITPNERTLYLDDRLDSDERDALERHCASCADCDRALTEEGATHTLLHLAFPMPRLTAAELRASEEQTLRYMAQVMREDRARRGLLAGAAERLSALLYALVDAPRWALAPMGAAALGSYLLLTTAGFKSPLVDFVVTSHAQQWPSEVSTSALDQVQSWLASHSTSSVRLDAPRFGRLANADVRLERARLSLAMVGESRWERAAHLLYSFAGGKRVTVIAFQGAPEELTEGEAREVEGVSVRVTQRDALTVASYSRGGLSYVVTSDLHPDELLKLIAADVVGER